MDGHALKKALMRRHQLAQHVETAAEGSAGLEAICTWMKWDPAQVRRDLSTRCRTPGAPEAEEYRDYFRHELRERLNAAKWAFVHAHPGDAASREIIALARSWQARVDRHADEDDRVAEFPSDEEAYGEPERRPEVILA